MSRKQVKLQNLTLGGKKIYVQSMLNVLPEDIEGNIRQALELEAAGCEIIRVSVPEIENAILVTKLKEALTVPVVADIHFDHRIAIAAVEAGADKIRINPGNIGSSDKIKAVAELCRRQGVPIRVGVNSGSVERDLLAKYGAPTAEALVESAERNVMLLEQFDFDNIVISIKSSDVRMTIEAYRLLAKRTDYPLHIGVTEAGTERMGLLKSAVGIGSLLCDGIGDTIRVSLTADPVREVYAGFDILKAVGLHENNVEIVSCPTCGRTKIDIIRLAHEVEEATQSLRKSLKIAVMGCAVNGPGEAREADIGIAGGDGEGVLFRKGEIIKKMPEEALLPALLEEIKKESEK